MFKITELWEMEVGIVHDILKKRRESVSCRTLPRRCSHTLSWRKVELLCGDSTKNKGPPFSLTEIWAIVINYGHEREDIIFLACEALYKSLGLTVLAQETASYIE